MKWVQRLKQKGCSSEPPSSQTAADAAAAAAASDDAAAHADVVYNDWAADRPLVEANGGIRSRIPQLCPKVHEYSELAAQCSVEERCEVLSDMKAKMTPAHEVWTTLTRSAVTSDQLDGGESSDADAASSDSRHTAPQHSPEDTPSPGNPHVRCYRTYRTEATREQSVGAYITSSYLSPHLFFLAPRGGVGGGVGGDTASTPILPMYSHVTRKVVLDELRIALELCDSSGEGLLCEADVELFVERAMPHLRTVRRVRTMMQGHYAVFYRCHAARKFFYFLDKTKRGRLHIDTILASDVLLELAKLYQVSDTDDDEPDKKQGAAGKTNGALHGTSSGQTVASSDGGDLEIGDVPEDLQNNWFTFQIMLRVYQHYVELDSEGDRNGMLSLPEMLGYNNHSFSTIFIERIFEKYPTSGYDQEIDFKRYLDFVLSTEHTSTLPAARYMWGALDIGECGFLAPPHVDLYTKQLAAKLASSRLMQIDHSDITREVFDMVNPANPERITFQDLLKCGQMGTVLSILVDHRAFHNYDARETVLASQSRGEG